MKMLWTTYLPLNLVPEVTTSSPDPPTSESDGTLNNVNTIYYMGNSPGLTHLAKKLNKVKGVSFDFSHT